MNTEEYQNGDVAVAAGSGSGLAVVEEQGASGEEVQAATLDEGVGVFLVVRVANVLLCVWLFVTVRGRLLTCWRVMAVYGCVWLCMFVYDYGC